MHYRSAQATIKHEVESAMYKIYITEETFLPAT